MQVQSDFESIDLFTKQTGNCRDGRMEENKAGWMDGWKKIRLAGWMDG